MIKDGSLAPGKALKPERQLAAEYGISRVTVRRVLDSFIRRGLLCRRRPVGTFVSEPAPPAVSEPSSGNAEFIEPKEAVNNILMPYIGGGSVCSLRFRISEPRNYQRDVWNSIIAEFHRRFPEINVEPVYMDSSAELRGPGGWDIRQVMSLTMGRELGFSDSARRRPPQADHDLYHPLAADLLYYADAIRGLPFSISIPCLMVNETLFMDLGVEPPPASRPLGVLEWLDKAGDLTAAARRRGMDDVWGCVHFGCISLLRQMGVPLYDAGRECFCFDSPSLSGVLKDIISRREIAYETSKNLTAFHGQFRKGRIGMLPRGTFEMPCWMDMPGYRVCPAPLDPGGAYHAVLLINTISKNSPFQEECWEFLHFLQSKEAQDIYASGAFNLPALLESQETYFRSVGKKHAFLRDTLARSGVFNEGGWGVAEFLSATAEKEIWAATLGRQSLADSLRRISLSGKAFLEEREHSTRSQA